MKKLPINNTLKKKGLKQTSQRLRILSLLEKSTIPLSPLTISKKIPSIDQATVYRNLGFLEKEGVVRRVLLSKNESLYELADTHHHHLVCEACGVVEDVDMCDNDMERAILKDSKKFKAIYSHSLEFFGMCDKCSKTQ